MNFILWQGRQLATPTVLLTLFLFAAPAQALTYPHLPIATVDVTCCPPITRTVAVHTAAQLQAAFDNATLGDEIVLDAGTTYIGNFILRVPKGTSGWVTVRTSAIASLPSPGTRVGSGDLSNMAKITSPSFTDNSGASTLPVLGNYSDGVTDANLAIHHYRFIGIEIMTGLASFNYHVILIGPPVHGTHYTGVGEPHDIIFDRCVMHGNDPFTTFQAGDTTPGTLNGGVYLDASNSAIVDSDMYDFWGRGNETQVLSSRGGPGPQLFQNNTMMGGAETYINGGALIPYDDTILTDVTFVHNLMGKNPAWEADHTIMIKNIFEMKIGKRVRFTDNVLDGIWVSADQYGSAIVLTARPAQDANCDYGLSGTCNASSGILQVNEVSDVLIANNVARNTGVFLATGSPDGQCVAHGWSCVHSARLLIVNNLAVGYTARTDGGFRGMILGGLDDWAIKRNTLLSYNDGGDPYPDAGFYANKPNGMALTCPQVTPWYNNFEFSYNILDGAAQSECAWDPTMALISSHSGTVSVTTNLPIGLTDPVLSAWVAFGHGTLPVAVDKAAVGLNSDFLTLNSSSPYYGTGVGADLSCFNEAAIRAGTPSPLCPLPSEAQSGPLPPDPTTTVAPGTFSPQVYPNPWRSDKHIGKPITFNQLVAGGSIKIFTTSGHKIKEIPVTNTSMSWNLENDKGDKVASGIYVYLITDGQGNKAKGKVAVIK